MEKTKVFDRVLEETISEKKQSAKRAKVQNAVDQDKESKNFSKSPEDNEDGKSLYSLALESAEKNVQTWFDGILKDEFLKRIAEKAREEITSQAEKVQDERTKEKLLRICSDGWKESESFTKRFSDTADGIQSFFVSPDVHEIFRAAKQSLLKVLIEERKQRKEEEEKQKRMGEELANTLSAEQLAALYKFMKSQK